MTASPGGAIRHTQRSGRGKLEPDMKQERMDASMRMIGRTHESLCRIPVLGEPMARGLVLWSISSVTYRRAAQGALRRRAAGRCEDQPRRNKIRQIRHRICETEYLGPCRNG